MARKHTFFSIKLQILAKFFVGLIISLFIISDHALPSIATNSPSTAELAQELTEEGHRQFSSGHIYTAISAWKKAKEIYNDLHDSDGVLGSNINESLGLQYLGNYPLACSTLAEALRLDPLVCPPLFELSLPYDQLQELLSKSLSKSKSSDLLLLGIKELGDVLRQLGHLDSSEIVLQLGINIASKSPPNNGTSNLLLSLGNTTRSYFEKSKNQYNLSDESDNKTDFLLNLTIDKATLSLELYNKVIKQNLAPETVLNAKLNRLSLLLDLDSWSSHELAFQNNKVKKIFDNAESEIYFLSHELIDANFSYLSSLSHALVESNLANSLLKLANLKSHSINNLSANENFALIGLSHSQMAYKEAALLGNGRISSTAAGLNGKLYNLINKKDLAEIQFRDATALALAINAWDLAYQWQYETAKLYKTAGNMSAATQAYKSAVLSLENVRGELLSVDPDYQFSFSEKIKPIYRQYFNHLIHLSNPNFEEILSLNRQLQSAEIENYLQCGRLTIFSSDQNNVAPFPATYINIINLGESYAVIMRDVHNKIHSHLVASKLINTNAEFLRISLLDPNFRNVPESSFQPYAQVLYEELIKPLKNYLTESGTLVFSVENTLLNIPMTLLYDGESYLGQSYNISLTLGTNLRRIKPLVGKQIKILLAGVSQTGPSFYLPQVPKRLQPLKEVNSELKGIQKFSSSTLTLLDQKFTINRFTDALKLKYFSIVHIGTHAQFSSDPQQTMVLTWDNILGIRELRNLVRGKPGDDPGFDLLTLSACETAKGDKRSTLGLAGVAVQSGAKSTVASLWLVNDLSTSELMQSFYKYLNLGDLKTVALHKAQQDLMKVKKYQHPYWWAPFILIGNWV